VSDQYIFYLEEELKRKCFKYT